MLPKSASYAESGPKNDSKATSAFYKIINIYWENACFLKIDPHTPKMISQRSHNDRKVTQNHSNIPKVTPTLLQSDPKVN